MATPFRFIHASDLHLERPPRGLAEVPDSLRPVLVEAPYRAAERIFDAAIKEHVDFVALAGDVVDPLASGPRGLVFLAEQFARLAAQSIRVYWAGGRSDDFERWVDAWPLGENVIRFPLHRVERMMHAREGHPLVQILGTSSSQRKKIRPADFRVLDESLFTLAVAYGSVESEAISAHPVQFWALGGEHERRNLPGGTAIVHYCGTPQGRRPQESGPRGCTLVQVDEAGRARTNFIATDAVRYLDEHLTIAEPTTGEQLYAILRERMAELGGDAFGPELLVHWTIAGSQKIAAELRRGKLSGELVARLRGDYPATRPAVWTVALEADREAAPRAELYEEETVLGELLRTVQHYVDHPEAELSLESCLAERHLAGTLGAATSIGEPAIRRRVLAEVARLGAELLGPQEGRP